MTTTLKKHTKGTSPGAGTFDIDADGVALTIEFARGKTGDLAWTVEIHVNGDRVSGGEGPDRLSAFRARRKPGAPDGGTSLPKVTDWQAVERVLSRAGAFTGRGGKA
jgi:hypothetical protein